MIEDSEEDAFLIERQLKRGGLEPSISRVWTAADMEKALDQQEWDIIICDYMLPTFSTDSALQIIKRRVLDVPFIIVSGAISEEIAVKMMKAGVQDYLKKDNLARLVPAIRRELKEAEERAERRKAEEALHESERKHRMLVASMSDIIFVIDKQGLISEFYSEIGFCLESNIEGIAGSNIADHLPRSIAEMYLEASAQTMDLGAPKTFEYPIECASGLRWFSASVSLHEDSERYAVVLRDVSELKTAEENLRASNKIGELYLDIMSHDIRNLLQAIKIGSDLLGHHYADIREMTVLQEMSDAVNRCDELISSVQGTGDLLQTPLELTSLRDAIVKCIKDFRTEHDYIKIEADCEPTKTPVRADKFLDLMVKNLLENAAGHSDEEDMQIWVKLRDSNGGFELSIADDGPGIRDELKEVLFDPNRRFGGVGIHVVRQIAEKYGGHIQVRDRIEGQHNMGAEFRVWLPKAAE
jgi:signal transduction histidine kinase/CheY-like chemotaxis protein